MNNPKRPRPLADVLQSAAAAYQDEQVIPHCPQCSKPCCQLEALVLELNWKQVKVLWRLDESRAAFDRRLAAGKGPEEIRSADGLYFAHRKPCPAYDDKQRNCRVYDQPVKPAGCSDFPVYEDGDEIIADLRCEAVDIDALSERIARAVGDDWRIVRSAHPDFPFLVSLRLRRQRNQPAPKVRRGRAT